MSAGRDHKARTNVRKGEIQRALMKRTAVALGQKTRRAAKRAKRRLLKARNQ